MAKDEVKVRFLAETSEFREGISNINADMSKMRAELKLNATQMKGNANDTTLLKERQSLLVTELQKSHEKTQLTNESLQKAKEIYGEDSKTVKEYETKLAYAKKQEEEIRQSLINCNMELENQKNAFDGAGEALTSFGGGATEAGEKATVTLTAPIIAAGTAMGNSALKFEDNMANINTLLDDESHLSGYSDKVKEMSNETGMDLDTMASGMYQAISSLGDGGKETEKIFGTMATSAKAGGAEVSDSVALISAGMKGYDQVNGETAQKISDLAFQTAKLGVTTFPEMAKSMQPLFPLSNSLNISYEELFGSMATLTGVTGNTAEVSTQLKAVFSNLMKPTSDMQAMIEKYGYSSGQAMIENEGFAGTLKIIQNETGGQADKMASLFSSTEAVTAMTALTGAQFENFNTKLGEMGNASGATEAAYDKLNTKGNALRKSVNQIKNTGTELGETLMEELGPAIEEGAEKIQGFADWFGKLDSGQKSTIITIAAVVAAIGPALIVIGKISTGLGALCNVMNVVKGAMAAKSAAAAADAVVSGTQATATGAATAAQTGLNASLLACPLTWIVVAIMAVIAVFVLLYNKCEWFRDGVNAIFEGVKNTFSSFLNKAKELKEKFSNNLSGMKEVAGEKLDGIKKAYEENGGGIKGILAASMKAQQEVFQSGYNAINTLTGGKLDELKAKTQSKLNGVKSVYQSHGGGVKGVIAVGLEAQKGLYEKGYNAINKLTGGKLDNVKNTMEKKLEQQKEKFQKAVDKVKKIFDFKLAWPKLKAPSISVSWKTEGNLAKAAQLLKLPGIPSFSVKWNAKGVILKKPTIFGFANGMFQGGGEAGMEALLPIEKMEEYIGNKMAEYVSFIPKIDYDKLGEAVANAVEKRPISVVANKREIARVSG